MTKALLAAGCSLLFLAAACGGGSGGGDAGSKDGAAVVTSMASAITSQTNGLLDAEKAKCVAKKFVDDQGVKKLKAAKVVDSKLDYADNGANRTAATSAAYSAAVLDCVKEKDVLTKMQDAMSSSYGAATAGVLTTDNVNCLVSDFITKAGVKRLFATHVISDAGAFNTADAKYDEPTATDLANAIIGCVDYLKSEAKGAAATDKSIDAAALETCLKAKITEDELRDSIVATIVGTSQADQESQAITAKANACQKSATKK